MSEPRDRTLDALRGVALLGMAAVNVAATSGDAPAWLRHAAWNGLGPADLVFPLFLYTAGVALVRAAGDGERPSRLPVGRTLRLLALGILLGAVPFGVVSDEGGWQWLSWTAVRLPGVLQRVALTTFLASVLLRGGWRVAGPAACLTLAAYPLLLVTFGDTTLAGNLAGAVDRALLGPSHLLGVEGIAFDPEGLLSTWPAAVTVLIGAEAAGTGRGARPVGALAVRALVFGTAGALLVPLVALNKSLWSSSFVLVTAATAAALHAGLGVLAGRGAARLPLEFLARAGRHSLALYVANEAAIALLDTVPWGEETLLDAVGGALFRSWAGPAAGTALLALAWATGLLACARGFERPGIGPAPGGRFGDNGA